MVLSVRGVSKVFPGTRALDHVDLDVIHGEVHGLVGGNGSGKSTLIKILSGVLEADGGTVFVGGKEMDVSHPHPEAAHGLGVRVVHQDLAVFPDLSVAENMMLGSGYPLSSIGSIQSRELRRRARRQIEQFEIAAEPDTLLRDLPVATRTQVAIARALQDVTPGQGVIILDEPTAALPAHEVELLLTALRRLAAQGHAILFVSHRLDEVMAVTNKVTVFRDGRVFAEHSTSELTEAELIESILGQRVDARAHRSPVSVGRPILSISGLSAGPLQDIDLEVMSGEVVGIAGLLGSGRSELLRAVYADLPKTAGSITVNGRPGDFSHMDQAIRAGVAMIPEDRANDAAFIDMTVDDNMNVSVLRRYWNGLGFQRSRLRRDADDLRKRFRVKAPSGSVAMRALSGGNQQKAILARWLRRDPVLLLLDEPTQGVDVGARADLYAAVRQVTDGGGAAVVVTSDLEELAQVVDRAVVLRQGRLTARVPHEELSAHRLNELIYMGSEKNDG